MHYYQPGIGTYTEGSVNAGFLGRMWRSIVQTLDQGLATSFDSHVIAGYRFLMRYYNTGDRIYIFGFSRGAFTARFLARMVSHVGLLSMGNEEMVPFAYKVYQDYQMNVPDKETASVYMQTFRNAFCRREIGIGKMATLNGTDPGPSNTVTSHEAATACEEKGLGIKVHFLGLWDCVGSVGTFEVGGKAGMAPPQVVDGTARFVRHAVAIDERRVKFKAALLAQDAQKAGEDCDNVKEVMFPGNHGDIGGGWPADQEDPKKPMTWFDWLKSLLVTRTETKAQKKKEDDLFQLSDIPLKWMIDELNDCDNKSAKVDEDRLNWHGPNKESFEKRYAKHRPETIKGRLHDTERFGGGSAAGKVIFWNIMGKFCLALSSYWRYLLRTSHSHTEFIRIEYLPFIRRWEYLPKPDKAGQHWKFFWWPLNCGNYRDVPPKALVHHSLLERFAEFGPTSSHPYRPNNDVNFGDSRKPVKLWDIPRDDEAAAKWASARKKHGSGQGTPLLVPRFVEQEKLKVGAGEADRIYELKLEQFRA